jgi:hypothetical protein
MSAHDDIAATILRAAARPGAELRLLGRLNDPLVGNGDNARDVFLFVPDLHLVSRAARARYAYGFNHESSSLLARVLTELAALADAWDDAGRHKLVTMQLGDFFDLWRELGPLGSLDAIGDDEHGALRDVLYRGVYRGRPCLKATMLLGNHDTQSGVPLPEVPFQLKAFNRSAAERPFLFATHGDAFDVLENVVPDPVEEFIVYFLGTLHAANKYPLTSWGAAAAWVNRPPAELVQAITRPEHALATAGAVSVTPGAALPDRLCELVAPDHGDHRFAAFYEAIGRAAGQYPSASAVRVAVCGHTHHAGLLLCEPPGGRPLVLLDAGAWIERCTYATDAGDRVTEPSAQLGVIHGNDVRLYQLHCPERLPRPVRRARARPLSPFAPRSLTPRSPSPPFAPRPVRAPPRRSFRRLSRGERARPSADRTHGPSDGRRGRAPFEGPPCRRSPAPTRPPPPVNGRRRGARRGTFPRDVRPRRGRDEAGVRRAGAPPYRRDCEA